MSLSDSQPLEQLTNGPILAVDPGRSKCGIAVVDSSGCVLYRSIVPADEIVKELTTVSATYQPCVTLVGNGTGSRAILQTISLLSNIARLTTEDEAYSSEEARKMYIDEHPARGYQRLLPKQLRTPDSPYDDYVAVILARRYLQRISSGPKS